MQYINLKYIIKCLTLSINAWQETGYDKLLAFSQKHLIHADSVNLSFHFWVAGGAVCNTKSNTLLDPDY